jgi:hypothetical protein
MQACMAFKQNGMSYFKYILCHCISHAILVADNGAMA